MAEVNLTKRKVTNNTNIGAIICHTPKTLNDIDFNSTFVDSRCVLLNSVDDLINYFGDPNINPRAYSDLLIAYNLVNKNIPVYVSSVYEMQSNYDGFEIPYNGYTDFTFKDEHGFNLLNYKLKSNIKFCQPIIQSVIQSDLVEVYVSLYYFNREQRITEFDLPLLSNNATRIIKLNELDLAQLYKTIHFSFKYNTTDKDIIDAFNSNGLELQINNFGDESTTLISVLTKYKYFKVSPDLISDYYTVDLHTDNYAYNFTDYSVIENAYFDAINRLHKKSIQPHFLCLSKLYKAKTVYANDSSGMEHIVSAYMMDLNPDNYIVIQNYLLEQYNNDSYTYLFINTPDVSFSTVVSLLSGTDIYQDVLLLNDNYNCDLFFGYITDYYIANLQYDRASKAMFSVALLTMYNILINNSIYVTNSLSNLNIPINYLKSLINKSSANRLNNLRCNTAVSFEINQPSIYGVKSLSRLPSLQYSHISRYVVYIRRLIHEYLETCKFNLNTTFNINSYINYIKYKILDTFVKSGILSYYDISYSIYDKNVDLKINLQFIGIIEDIQLNFTI